MTQLETVEFVSRLTGDGDAFASAREVADEAGCEVTEAAPALSRAHRNSHLRRLPCEDDNGRRVYGFQLTASGRKWLDYRLEREALG